MGEIAEPAKHVQQLHKQQGRRAARKQINAVDYTNIYYTHICMHVYVCVCLRACNKSDSRNALTKKFIGALENWGKNMTANATDKR